MIYPSMINMMMNTSRLTLQSDQQHIFGRKKLKYDNQPVYINHDDNEENAENFKVSEKSLPLCSSFQFLREIYK
jgi:hypothetical protein